MNKLKFIVVGFFVGLSLFLSQVNSAGLTYNYPLYPYSKDLSQTLTFKVMLRCALPVWSSVLEEFGDPFPTAGLFSPVNK